MNDLPPIKTGVVGQQPLSKKFIDVGLRVQSGGFARSRFVAAMKYILPGLAMTLLVVVVSWPEFDNDNDRFRAHEAVGPIGASRPQVINARLLSVDSQLRPFQITADSSSLKKNKDREFYLLVKPKAEIVLEDGSWVTLSAKDGEYEDDKKYLYLFGDVSVFHNAGHELRTPKALFDLDSNSASGDEKVEGQGPLGTLQSEGFRMFDGGDRIMFTGKTQMLVYRGVRSAE